MNNEITVWTIVFLRMLWIFLMTVFFTNVACLIIHDQLFNSLSTVGVIWFVAVICFWAADALDGKEFTVLDEDTQLMFWISFIARFSAFGFLVSNLKFGTEIKVDVIVFLMLTGEIVWAIYRKEATVPKRRGATRLTETVA